MAETVQPGLKSAAQRFAAHALALGRSRLELASVELAIERERLQLRLALLFAGVLLLVFAALGVAGFVVSLVITSFFILLQARRAQETA